MMTEKTEIEIMESHWLNWCRLCAKDDVCGNVKMYTGETANTWNNVLVMAIVKYFNVHMRLEDDLSGFLCKECYTLVSELIDFSEHVNKVQAIFETLRCSEPGKKLDVESLRRQYGLREEDWTHIIKPVLEFDNNVTTHSDDQETKQDFIDYGDCFKIVQLSQALGNTDETNVNQLPIEEITIPGGKTVNETQNSPPQRRRGRKRSCKVFKTDFEEEVTETFAEQAVEISDCDKNDGSVHGEINCSSQQDDLELMHASFSASAADSEFHPDYTSGSEGDNDYDLDKPVKRKKLECRRCGKVYHNPGSFKKHLQLNCRKKEQQLKLDKRFYCKLCDKTLSSASSFKQHEEGMHSNVRPYVCDHCGKQVKTITALNEHKLVHTEDRPFDCSICQAGFKSKASLRVHYQIHEEPKYVCNICGKKLQTRRTWNMHKLVHSDDRKFKCDLCDSKFKRSKTLKRHLLSHTGLRPYVCNYCDKSFACNSNCRIHQLKKHPQELKKDEDEHSTCRLKLPTLNELRVMSKTPKAGS